MRKVDTNKKFYVTSKQARKFNKEELARKYRNGKRVYKSIAEYRNELKRVIKECETDTDEVGNCMSSAQLKFYSKCLEELGFTFENEYIRYSPKSGVVINKELTAKSPNRKGKVIEKYVATSETPLYNVKFNCIKVQFRDFEQGYVIKEVKKKK